MEEKMDGWMDGWMDRWMDGWMDGGMNEDSIEFYFSIVFYTRFFIPKFSSFKMNLEIIRKFILNSK